MDVARYADSAGFANDFSRPNAWRYRDYVVRAFNNDKPYDQFIREQIAGDELAEDGLRDSHSTETSEAQATGSRFLGTETSPGELIIAAGFLRMGPWELTGMEVPKVARQRFLDDVTDAVGQVFLAHMLQCCRCHDHKFDPIPTRDYYAFQANFTATQLAERTADFLPAENTEFHDEKRFLIRRKQFYESHVNQLEAKRTLAAARQWLTDEGRDAALFEAAVAELTADVSDDTPGIDAVRRRMRELNVDPALIPPRHVGFEPRDFGLERVVRKGLARLKWQLDRYEPVALSVYSGPTPDLKNVDSPLRIPQDRLSNGEVEQTYILTGGDPFSPGQPVEPGILSVMTKSGPLEAAPLDPESPVEEQGSRIRGHRTELADWMASKDNPLTARVMVNRIWQWHFGQAIAGNPNNFGATGKKPTHPELLDWLAREFMNQGWSVKHMHRTIMMSQAYRRASSHPAPKLLATHDSGRSSYAVFRPRRLTAEELRDTMLSVSGELNPELGGIPARPEMNLEAALQPRMVMGTFAEAWQPSPLPEQRHRRSIYTLKLRGLRDPFFEVFNAPSPDLSCEARDASTVTPQVFAMLNSEITFDRALAFAKRVTDETNSSKAAVHRIFRLACNRTPTAEETQACLDHWAEMTERHRHLKFDAPEYPPEIVREAVEENTGEKFTFTEPLEVYEEFVPDLTPSDTDPELRGLAEVCLVILNSSEFVWIY